MEQMNVGKAVISLMVKNNIKTIKELQGKSGISRATLSNIINGKQASYQSIIKLCQTFNCDVSDLVDRQNSQ